MALRRVAEALMHPCPQMFISSVRVLISPMTNSAKAPSRVEPARVLCPVVVSRHVTAVSVARRHAVALYPAQERNRAKGAVYARSHRVRVAPDVPK